VAKIDAALDLAAETGWAWLRLPETSVLTADSTTMDTIVALVRRLGDRAPQVSSERTGGRLQPSHLAVAV
jgi:hypothetical protein